MPELPEVQRFKRYLDANALHQTIKDLQVDTSRILEAISEKTLRPRVQGRAFSESRRHGKYLSLNSRKVAGRTSIYCPRCQH